MEKQLLHSTELQNYQPVQAICFISRGQLINIPISEIMYICKSANETKIYTQQSSYVSYQNLQELLQVLPVNDFFRVNKSVIVCRKRIVAIEKYRIRVQDRWFSFSRYYRSQFIRHMGQLLNAQYQTLTIRRKP